jgi:hypothetical protein
MAVYETYSKRQKKLRGELPDVYTYDEIPQALRIQIVQIILDVLGDKRANHYSYEIEKNIDFAYNTVISVLRKEMACFRLPHNKEGSITNTEELTTFLLRVPSADDFLSATELVCLVIESTASKYNYRNERNANFIAKDAIDEINARFKEHGVGYEYDGEIIRIDAELVHAEAVKPALSLLRDARYQGAEDEFLKAYAHYRKGDNKEALNEALKALESTMKTICDKRGWTYAKTDTASKLLKVCFDNTLIPAFWESHFSALRSTLEAGVPTGRNKLSGHGQGGSPTTVPDHLAGYILHMTASAIVFLIKAEKELP